MLKRCVDTFDVSGEVRVFQSLIDKSTISAFFETTFVRLVKRPRWWHLPFQAFCSFTAFLPLLRWCMLFHGLRSSSGRDILLSCRQGLTWRSRRTRKSGAPLNFSVRLKRESMPFPPTERKALLAVKGVGPTVIARLEQMGFESLAHLSKANALDIVSKASAIVGSTCWKNSPQARAAIQAAITLAQSHHV